MSVTTSPSHDSSLEVRGSRQISATPQEPISARRKGRLLAALPSVIFALVLLGLWYLATASGRISSLILPAPGDVLSSLLDGFSSGIFLSNIWVTMQESLLGFLLALGLALPIGYGLAKSRFFAATVHPYLAAGQAIPALVLAPFLGLWIGYDLPTYIIISMIVVIFPIIVNTQLGLQTIDREITDAARVQGASPWTLLLYVEFPLALPSILAAVRTGLTLSVIGALVGEFVLGSDQGLGGLMLIGKNQYNMPLMFATVIVLALLAGAYYGAAWGITKIAEAVY